MSIDNKWVDWFVDRLKIKNLKIDCFSFIFAICSSCLINILLQICLTSVSVNYYRQERCFLSSKETFVIYLASRLLYLTSFTRRAALVPKRTSLASKDKFAHS